MKVNLNHITTEQRNLDTIEIDNVSTVEVLQMINYEDSKITDAIKKEIDNISKVVDDAYTTIKNGGKLFYIGAGTSGRLGVLDASEMPPTFNVSNDVIIGLIAGGDEALRNPIEGAEDSLTMSIDQLNENDFTANDMLIGIAASGRTPYVVSALEHANKIGAKTASISTSENSEIGKIADTKIDVVTGPEVITGSTRMKSGTAQKLVLNMISTTTMIKLGKVYKNWMIDVKPSNEKLIERAINIVIEITGEDREKVIDVLNQSNNSPKHAVLMIMKDIGFDEAKRLLDSNDNRLSKLI